MAPREPKVEAFKANLGRPPKNSFAALRRNVTGNVSLSAGDWMRHQRMSQASLQSLFGMTLHGNPSSDSETAGGSHMHHASHRPFLEILGDTDLPIMGYNAGYGDHDVSMLGRLSSPHMEHFPPLGGPEFVDTHVFQRYQALLADTEDCVRYMDRALDGPDIVLCAQTNLAGATSRGAGQTTERQKWRLQEGITNFLCGPHAYDQEMALDAIEWARLSDAEQFSTPGDMLAEVMPKLPDNVAYIVPRHLDIPGGVPIGYARFRDARDAEPKLAYLVHEEISYLARMGIAHTLFHLLAAHEMYGTVYASTVVGVRFIRFYVLGANRIAVELAPLSGKLKGTLKTRTAISYNALGICACNNIETRVYQRLPWSLTQNTTLTPQYRSSNRDKELASDNYFTDPNAYRSMVAAERFNKASLDVDAVQTFISFAAAATIRMARLNCKEPLTRIPTPLQDKYLNDLTEATVQAGAKHGLPPELSLGIDQLSLGRTKTKPVEFDETLLDIGLNCDALEMVLEEAALYVPVTSAEMDELVAAQVQSDLEAYTPVTDPPTRTFADNGANGL